MFVWLPMSWIFDKLSCTDRPGCGGILQLVNEGNVQAICFSRVVSHALEQWCGDVTARACSRVGELFNTEKLRCCSCIIEHQTFIKQEICQGSIHV